MTDRTPKHPFSADRPITSAKEDRLGKTVLAESLASAIKGWKGNDSLVIALYGSWGSGKSSIKNMVLESLRKSKKDCPKIVEFRGGKGDGPFFPGSHCPCSASDIWILVKGF